jgi:pimeloyl-ACP methyl ester carboxylesterase
MVKPTIVLVHGFWGGAAHWSKVIPRLNKIGYTSIFARSATLTGTEPVPRTSLRSWSTQKRAVESVVVVGVS